MSEKSIPIRVAVRIRPLSKKELDEGSRPFVSKVRSQPQVSISSTNEAFTFDYVFGQDESQTDLYDTAIQKIIGKIFKGYNVTIVAYGQTGSGKTFTMGTADSVTAGATISETSGIIQRAVRDLFLRKEQNENFTMDIRVSFLEVFKFLFSQF